MILKLCYFIPFMYLIKLLLSDLLRHQMCVR